MSRAARGALLAVALGVALTATGCNEFKYFDIRVVFDNQTFNFSTVREVSVCRVTVSGADSASFRILNNCPPVSVSAPYDVGVFTYSSFAESGNITFKVDTYTGTVEKPDCINGSGTTTVAVGGMTTVTGMLKIVKTGPGCTNVTPINDGGP
jgi:hypothetical protein